MQAPCLLRYLHWPLCQFFVNKENTFLHVQTANVNANSGGCSKMANVPF